MPSQALQTFEFLIENVDQLIEIHGRLQTGRGRRHQQEALHRAGVVMSVGAWESYVESVLLEAVELLSNNLQGAGGAQPAPRWAQITFAVAMQSVENKVSQFHTPNAENVQRIFRESIGFDPWPHWSWFARRRQWNGAEMRQRLNSWLKIRHGIAHGAGLPTNIDWIQADNGNPRLTRRLLQECRRFVGRLAEQTDSAMRGFLVNQHGIANPW